MELIDGWAGRTSPTKPSATSSTSADALALTKLDITGSAISIFGYGFPEPLSAKEKRA
jgi:hypothetical protein